jgi:hypothetical protein
MRVFCRVSQVTSAPSFRAAHQAGDGRSRPCKPRKTAQRAAAQEFRQLKRQRMLQADPTIQPILEKMPARRGGRNF